jgi:hypothetical protein
MQATKTYRRLSISRQLLVATTALLAMLLIASAYLASRTSQAVTPATVHSVASPGGVSHPGSTASPKYREPSTRRPGPQLVP